MEDSKAPLCFLVEVAVETGQLEAKYAHQLLAGKTWIDHGAKHVEKSLHAEFLPNRGHAFHGWMKERGMQKAQAHLV